MILLDPRHSGAALRAGSLKGREPVRACKRSSIRTGLEQGGNTNLVGARNPAPEMLPRYGIRMARAGFCTMRLITLLLVHTDTAVSFSRATSRMLISSSNSFFTVGHSTLV